MPKSTKRFIISDAELNEHGFRVLTEGIDAKGFVKNPVCLWMHVRADGTIEKMPIGYWDDLERDGKNYTGIPNLDDSDPLAMKVFNKVEHGSIRAASAGLIPVELSDDPNDMLPGQTNPTYKRSRLKEASLVDIGSNPNAVTLYDKNGMLVTLNAGEIGNHFKTILKQQNADMKIVSLNAPAVFALLKLDPEKATEAEALAEVQKIITLAVEQGEQITTLSAAKTVAENKVAELEKLANTGKIVSLVAEAVASRKITAGQKEHFEKLAAVDFATTEALLKSLPGSPTLQSVFAGRDAFAPDASELAELMKLSWNDLDSGGKLEKLRKLDVDSYKLKYKEKFGKEPAII